MIAIDILRRLRFSLLLSLALCAPAAAGDTWTTPFNGVRYLHRTTGSPKWDMHVAVVNLSVPGVRLTATSPKDRRTTVSAFAKREGTQVAINASFFSYSNYSTVGLSVGEGTVWTGTKDDGSSGQLVFGEGRAEIVNPAENLKVEPWMTGIVSGHPLLVWNGQPVAQSKNSSLAQSRHPRTAVGLSKDRRTLFLLVVDGRQNSSVGMTAAEEAQVLKGLGAWTALNMDGGGSSAMYIKGHGIVNRPSDGAERVVANHLGVLLGKAAAKKDNAAKAGAGKQAAAEKQGAAKEPADKSAAAKAAAEKAAAAAKEAAAKSAAAKAAAAKAADAKAAAAKASAGNDAAAKAAAEKDVAEKEAAAKAATRKAAAALNTAAKLSAKAAAAKAAEIAVAAQDAAAKKTAEISAAANDAVKKAEAATAPARKKASEMAVAAQDAAEKKTAEIAAAANDAVKKAEAATAPARKKAAEAAGAAHDAAEKKGAEIADAAKDAAKKAEAVKEAAEKKAEAETRSLTRMFNEGYRKIADLWGRFTQWVKRSVFR